MTYQKTVSGRYEWDMDHNNYILYYVIKVNYFKAFSSFIDTLYHNVVK